MRCCDSSFGSGSLGFGESVQIAGEAAKMVVSQGPTSSISCSSNGLQSSRLQKMVRVADFV